MLRDARAQDRFTRVVLVVVFAAVVLLVLFSYLWDAVPALHIVLWWGANVIFWVLVACMAAIGTMSARFS